MAEQLSPELIATLESRVEKIRADYNERLQKDREFIKGVVSKASFAAALVVSVAAYFGISGFDDLVDRAIQKTNPREKWAAVLDDVRDHALVYGLVTSRESRVTPYTTFELEAFNRLLSNPATRDQMFHDVVSLLQDANRAPDVTSTLSVMRTLLAAKGESEWIKDAPRKQQLLVSYLAERKFDAASYTVLPYLDSHFAAVQLAAIRYAKECHIGAAMERLSKLVKQHPTDDIGSAAAIALVSIAPGQDDAKKWLAALKERSERSLEEAAKALRQLGNFAQGSLEPVRASSSRSRSDAPPAPGSANGDVLAEIIVDFVRSALLKGYFLTVGEYYDRPGEHLLYLAKDPKTWSEEAIPMQLLSPSVVDKLLRKELAEGNMANFKRFVHGLTGISTGRHLNDVQREVVFILDTGEIEFAEGAKYSKAAAANTAGLSWAIRQWRLKLNDYGELIAESVARPELHGNVRAITAAKDSGFRLNTSARAVDSVRPPPRSLARAEVASASGPGRE
jgi:hypothetical protein